MISGCMVVSACLLPSLRWRERIVLVSGVEAAVLAHEGGRAAVDTPTVGRAPVLVAVPAESHGVRLLVDEHEVLHARRLVAVDLDNGHVADELATGRGG